MTYRVLALLGTGLVDPDAPILTADNLGVLRGDGIFETMLVRNGQPWLPDEHLQRFDVSAQRMQLTLPPITAWHDLIRLALSAWDPRAEGVLRLVCTRGREGAGRVTGYAYVSRVAAETLRQRAQGVSVVTAALGLASTTRQQAPWLLGGVKTTSYATNLAAGRYAHAQRADDVIYLSSDGQVLEGPTSSVVWAHGGTLSTVPVETGILAGTTVGHLMRRASTQGFTPDARLARIEDLNAADAVWLVSSVRGAVPVLAIDGAPRGEAGLTGRVLAALGLTSPRPESPTRTGSPPPCQPMHGPMADPYAPPT